MIEEIMKYIESEFVIINNTPCEICGGYYLTDNTLISLRDGVAFDVCQCICENCGHQKQFQFLAPFILDRTFSTENNSKLN